MQQEDEYHPLDEPLLNLEGQNQRAQGLMRQRTSLRELNNQGQTEQFKKIQDDNMKRIQYEGLLVVYFTICLLIKKEEDKLTDLPECTFQTRRYVSNGLTYILYPLVIMRVINQCMSKRIQTLTFMYGLSTIFYFLGLGIYTWTGLIPYFSQAIDGCFNGISLNFFNFLILLLEGFPLAFVVGLFACCIPCICLCCCYAIFDAKKRQALKESIVQGVAKTKFNSAVYTTQKECAICLMEFEENSEITPLPCDIRHFFHTECINQWILTNPNCPLCKKVITKEEMDALAAQLEEESRNNF